LLRTTEDEHHRSRTPPADPSRRGDPCLITDETHQRLMLNETIGTAAAAIDISTAVSADGVARRYGEGEAAVDALRGVSLDVPAGQFTAIMGPSGSGKSTLMHLLAGLDRPTAGSVYVGTQDITTMSDKALTKLRRQHIGFVFQSFNLLPTLSAEENVLLPLTIAGRKIPRETIDALLERVGLTERRRHRPSELSGGQQQRVAIARALISEPTVLFADEPTGNLDSNAGAMVLDLLREAVDIDGQTTVMVTHDPLAAARADRVLFLADGRIVSDLAQPTEADVLAQMKAVSA
jgi:putative ABC transport system ATP-binding protein